ncbi:MAG: hypothetical protein ACFCGT_22740 [Sandaracinaceae bacterium]
MSSSSLPLSVLDPLPGAVDVVLRFREALSDADASGVVATRWEAPRPPGERDMLSDLAAAEGMEAAVRRLSRFWRRSQVATEQVRPIHDLEAEVYERVHTPRGETLAIVSLVRRQDHGSPWKVVCTAETHDERLLLWLTTEQPVLDESNWTSRFADTHGPDAELLMDGEEGVLSHPGEGWLAQVRGPFVPTVWPRELPPDQARVIELAFVLDPDLARRRGQLAWALRAADLTATLHASDGVYLPSHDKLILPETLWQAARQDLAPDQLYRLWARLDEVQGYYVTTGLRQLGLPELEAPVDLLEATETTRRTLIWLAGRSIGDVHAPPSLGTEVLVGRDSLEIVAGRRGPRRGRSYGRWGAIGLVRITGGQRRGSRSRLRVPD